MRMLLDRSLAAADEDGVDEPDAIVFTPAVDPRHYDDTEFTEETHGAKTQTGARLQGCKTCTLLKIKTANFCNYLVDYNLSVWLLLCLVLRPVCLSL